MAGNAVNSMSETVADKALKAETRDRQRPLKVWVSALEREEIEERAASSCLPISAYLRAAALSHPIRRIYDLKAIEPLAVVGRDLSRLGEVLGELLKADVSGAAGKHSLGRVLEETRAVQQRLLELMSRA